MLIDRLVKWFLPHEGRFFMYLESIAKNVVHGADTFAELREAKGPEGFQQIAERLRRIEHEGDEIAHLLYEELDKTFVTPIDREDLHSLTSTLDDVLDIIESCAVHIVITGLTELTEPMRELVRVAREAAREVAGCVTLLRDLTKADEIQVHVVHVNTLENEGDKIYRKALQVLFATVKDPIQLIREREILDALERSIDACEDVMDLVRSVVVKNG